MTSGTISTLILGAALLMTGASAGAQDDPLRFDFDHVVTDTFWNQLYPAGGWTLLCGEAFDSTRRLPDGRAVAVDHIYSVAEMMRGMKCQDRNQCRTRVGEKFTRMESDLHNMYPEIQELVVYRSDRDFGIVDGEEWRYDNCDVEWRNGLLEPRELVRGNIARAILYMRATYRISISGEFLELLKAWNREDPPSKQELERNDLIEKLQGRRNVFTDDPKKVENLRNVKK